MFSCLENESGRNTVVLKASPGYLCIDPLFKKKNKRKKEKLNFFRIIFKIYIKILQTGIKGWMIIIIIKLNNTYFFLFRFYFLNLQLSMLIFWSIQLLELARRKSVCLLMVDIPLQK